MQRTEIEKKQLQQNVARDTQLILKDMQSKGFQTNPGTNTHLLANIIADFVNKTISRRKHEIQVVSLWGSDEIEIVAPIAFLTYGIYNERHQPEVYDLTELGDFSKTTLYQPIPNFTKLVYIGNNQGARVQVLRKTLSTIHDSVNLQVNYSSLMRSSILEANDQVFQESFMSETGVYVPGDYIILPDEQGKAVLYTITDLSEFKSLKLVLFTQPNDQKIDYAIPRVQEAIYADANLLKFTITQLMQNFAKFRGMTPQEFREFVELRYHKPCCLVTENNQDFILGVDLGADEISRLQRFVELNILKPLTSTISLEVVKPHEQYITLKSDADFLQNCFDYISNKVQKISSRELLIKEVFQLLDQFYLEAFGLDARSMKANYPIEIEVSRVPEGITIVKPLFVLGD